MYTQAELNEADISAESAANDLRRLGNSARFDIALCILLVIAGFCLTWVTSHALPLILREHTTENVWFESGPFHACITT